MYRTASAGIYFSEVFCMNCCIDEICNKTVINIENGCKVGYVYDVEADMCSGQISALLVAGNEKGLMLRRPECFRISWCDIAVIGEETILVKNIPLQQNNHKSGKSIFGLFSK